MLSMKQVTNILGNTIVNIIKNYNSKPSILLPFSNMRIAMVAGLENEKVYRIIESPNVDQA